MGTIVLSWGVDGLPTNKNYAPSGTVVLLIVLLTACDVQTPSPEDEAPQRAGLEAVSNRQSSPDRGASANLPAYRDPLVKEWMRLHSLCRGPAPYQAYCDQRDALDEEVRSRGWCYARGPEGGHDWLSCDETTPNGDGSYSSRWSATYDAVLEEDPDWYLVATKFPGCARLEAILGVATPEDLVALYERNGISLEIAHQTELTAQVRESGNEADPGMGLVRGRLNCEIALLRLMGS